MYSFFVILIDRSIIQHFVSFLITNICVHELHIYICRIDATHQEYAEHLGRFINHGRQLGNVVPKKFLVLGKPRIIFLANREIEEGEELFYDYADWRKSVVAEHPWLMDDSLTECNYDMFYIIHCMKLWKVQTFTFTIIYIE